MSMSYDVQYCDGDGIFPVTCENCGAEQLSVLGDFLNGKACISVVSCYQCDAEKIFDVTAEGIATPRDGFVIPGFR